MKAARVMILRSTDSYGGAERQIVGFARRLNPSFFHPIICGFAGDTEGESDFLRTAAEGGLETALVEAYKGFDLGGMSHVVKLARDLEVDLLCPQDYRANVYALAAARRLHIPLVATAHGYTGHTRSVQLYEGLDRLMVLRRMDAVVCVSESYRKRLARWTGHAKLYLVHNSIDPEAEGCAAEPGTTGPEPRVCSVGRLSVEKGHRFLLEAWPQVLKQVPKAKLTLVGDGPEKAKLLRQARELGIEGSVEFAGFTSSPTQYVKECSVFVLPSLTEGLPVALLEACAASRAIVASDVGGIGEVISSMEDGMLVRAGRPDELAESIILLLKQPETARLMGQQARRTVEERFSYERNLPVLQRVYLSHLKG